MPTRARTIAILMLPWFCTACDPPAEVQRLGGLTMGSTYEVKFVGPQRQDQVQAVVAEELAAFDLAFSRWRPDSEICRLNRHVSTEPFPVSARFAAVLELALEIAAVSGGAFDPTIGPLTGVYRAAKAEPGRPLDEAALAAKRGLVDHRLVTVRDGAVRKARAEMELDLDGIVAGACADAIAARLDALGVPAFYLEITGEVLCRGEKAPGVPWIIGVVDPAADVAGGDAAITTLPLRNLALCTSGDYRNALVSNGKVVHHIFDPRTGRSAAHDAVSVSVLARSAAVADALGTALLVLGPVEAAPVLGALGRYGDPGVLFLIANPEGGFLQKKTRWPE